MLGLQLNHVSIYRKHQSLNCASKFHIQNSGHISWGASELLASVVGKKRVTREFNPCACRWSGTLSRHRADYKVSRVHSVHALSQWETTLHCYIGAVRHQFITWANFDPVLCRYIASLGLNELINILKPCDKYCMSLWLQTMACHHLGAKPLTNQCWHISSITSL